MEPQLSYGTNAQDARIGSVQEEQWTHCVQVSGTVGHGTQSFASRSRCAVIKPVHSFSQVLEPRVKVPKAEAPPDGKWALS